ncbi:hypothetical protein ACVWYO_003729 [Sphingomonas sp. UYP23]
MPILSFEPVSRSVQNQLNGSVTLAMDGRNGHGARAAKMRLDLEWRFDLD